MYTNCTVFPHFCTQLPFIAKLDSLTTPCHPSTQANNVMLIFGVHQSKTQIQNFTLFFVIILFSTFFFIKFFYDLVQLNKILNYSRKIS
jgi:type III secretory pathway component EscS